MTGSIGTQRRRAFSVLAFLISTAAVMAAEAGPAPTEEKKDEAEKLDSFHVIGSRIKRMDDESVAPVVTITSEDIDVAGDQTLGEFVRNLPYNSSTSIDPQFVTGFATGATTLNLRGLGANNTLVLVNGRRVSPYGIPGGSGFTTLFDFNSVPLAAIDRVEILKDGASALYGSDAAAGVVNLKLRNNYNGFSVSTLYGNTTDTDSGLQSVNATWGKTFGKTSVLLVADWQTRHSIFLRDRAFSTTADGRNFGGQDARSTTGFPGSLTVPTRDAAGRTPPAGTITGTLISPQGVLLANPTVADFARGATLYNFNEDTALLPDMASRSIYGRARQEVNDRLYFFGEVSLRKIDGEFVQAATPIVNTNEVGTGPTGFLRLPFNNPYNPFGVDIDSFRFRLLTQGPRVRESESIVSRYLLGAGGRVGPGDWTWESALLYSKNEMKVDDFNLATDAAVQNLLNQTSRVTALNPFGPSAPGVVESLATTINRRAFVDIRQVDFQGNGHVWQLPAGELGVALGGEYRRESARDRPDPLASSGAIIALGGSSGLSAVRRVTAAYVELSIPLLQNLEAQIAGRHEQYSDFGTADKPKFGLKYRAAKWLLLRGGFSRSFRAPDLTQLFTAQTIGFSNGVKDPLRPSDPVMTVRTINGGNASLRPELTDSSYLGAVVEVPGVKGLEATVDFWRFRQTNLISAPSISSILDLETTVPSGRVVRNPATGDGLPGTINSVSLTFLNVSRVMTDGVDLAVRYTRPTELGRFVFNTAVTYTHSYEFNSVEAVKTNGFPMFRGNASVQWSAGRWSASLQANYLDGYAEPTSSIFGPGKAAAHRTNHNYTFNPQVSCQLGSGTKVTLGARNVFDRDPPHALGKPEEYDNSQVTGEGRFVFLRVSQEF